MKTYPLYSAYGLCVRAHLLLPELDVWSGSYSEPDVQILRGRGPFKGGPELTRLESPPSLIDLTSPDLSFRIAGGRQIEVWARRSHSRRAARAVLLGVAFSALLYQRRLWPLHVSAVRVGEGVWLFGGASGEGKSTLAAWLLSHYLLPIVSDDSGVSRIVDSRVLFSPGSRTLRLLPEALPHTFPEAAGLKSDFERKHHLRLPVADKSADFPVLGLVMLQSSEDAAACAISRITGSDALQAIRTSLFKPVEGRNLCSPQDMLRFAVDFLDRVPVYRMVRRRSFADYGAQIRPLLELLLAR